MSLTDEQIDAEWFDIHHLNLNNVAKARLLARAIESAATAPLLERIAELEASANTCGSGAGCCYQAARITELEREIEAVRKDAERYRWLRDRDHWPAAFDSHSAPEPVRGAELDVAIDAAKEQG